MKIPASTSLAELLPQLEAEMRKTIAAYHDNAGLRAKKIEQDLKQIEVYLEILQNRAEGAKLTEQNLKRLGKALSWKPKTRGHHKSYRKQQDQFEDHFLEIQKILVGILSKRFKY